MANQERIAASGRLLPDHCDDNNDDDADGHADGHAELLMTMMMTVMIEMAVKTGMSGKNHIIKLITI